MSQTSAATNLQSPFSARLNMGVITWHLLQFATYRYTRNYAMHLSLSQLHKHNLVDLTRQILGSLHFDYIEFKNAFYHRDYSN